MIPEKRIISSLEISLVLMLSIIPLLRVLVMARVEFDHESVMQVTQGIEALEKNNRICKSIHKQHINKRKTTESQRKERGSELKKCPTSLWYLRWTPARNDLLQYLVHLPSLAVPE